MIELVSDLITESDQAVRAVHSCNSWLQIKIHMQFKKRLSKKFDKDIARISTKLKEKNNNGISTFFFAISQYKVLNNNYATPPGNIYVVQSVARLILAPAPVTYFCFPFRGFKKSSCQYGRAIGPNIFDFSLVFSGSST